MAVVNIQVTPVLELNQAPFSGVLEDSTRYAPVKLTIIASQTYSQTDQCALIHTAGSDFFTHFGAKTIKQILAEPIACSGVSFGLLKLVWNSTTQKGQLNVMGNGGSTAPTGPQVEAQLAGATALGAGLQTCNALIFW